MSIESASQPSAKKAVELGPVRMAKEEIPAYVKENAARKLPEGVDFYPAREGGAYKGPIVYATKDFIVQGLTTKDESKASAIVHKRSDLELVTSNLKWREENKRLGSTLVQAHYKGEGGVPAQTGKVYNWNPEREAADRAAHKAKIAAEKIANPAAGAEFLKDANAKIRSEIGPKNLAEPGPEKAKQPAKMKPEPAKDKPAQEPKAKAAKAPKKTADKAGPER